MHCCPRCKLLCCEPTVRTKTTRGRQSWNFLSQRQASWRPLLRGFLAGCRGHSPSGTPSSVRVGWKKSKTLLRFQQRDMVRGVRQAGRSHSTLQKFTRPSGGRSLALISVPPLSRPSCRRSETAFPSGPRSACGRAWRFACGRSAAARSVRCGAVHPSG
jgi:hypothetical protein